MPANDWKHPEGDELDRELNAALVDYSAVAPRPGIEARVLANLRTPQAQASFFAWWRRGAWATIMTIVIMAAALLWKSEVRRRRAGVNPPPAATRLRDSSTQVAVDRGEENSIPDRPVPNRSAPTHRALHRRRSTAAGPPTPKLDVFPSPQPLSAEELALARYIERFPQEAIMIARMQEEYRQKTREQMREAGFEVPAESSELNLGFDERESSN